MVVVHGASHPLPPPPAAAATTTVVTQEAEEAEQAPLEGGGDGSKTATNGGKQPPRGKAVRVEEAAAFKRARALYPLRPRPALRAVAVPPQMQGAAAAVGGSTAATE